MGRFKPQPRFISDKIYSRIRDTIVRTCVEALVMDEKQNQILLGQRNILPWNKWWSFGGRMIAGESPEGAVSRVVKEDLGLEIRPKRFVFLDTLSLVFSRREEPPQKNGCHDMSLFFLLLLDERETAAVHLRETEYQEKKWFNPKDITKKAGFHPATVICLKRAMELKEN